MDEHGNIIPNPALNWKTLEEGSATTIVAAFDPEITGKSYHDESSNQDAMGDC